MPSNEADALMQELEADANWTTVKKESVETLADKNHKRVVELMRALVDR
jgi:hypothetical protein